MPKRSGFTLIELLVVITIIGILSVMGMAAYTSLTTKAKDIKKKADIDQIASVYELRYDNKTHKYKVLTDADFSNNKPDTTNYTGVLGSDAQTFNICATLSDNTTYCKESAHQASVVFVPAPAPAPVAVPTSTFACADNTNDQVYTSTMIGCNGSPGGSQSVLFSQAASLCNAGWHVCSLDEYLANGGRTIPSNNREQWLDTRAGCSVAALCGSGFFAISRPSFETGCSFSSSNGCGNFIDQCGQNPSCINASSHQAQLWGAVCCKNIPTPTPTPTPTPVPCLSGLLANGCFEGSSATAEWNCGGAVSGSCTGDSTIKYAGSSSVKITNTGGWWGWQLSQGNISASLGEQFCLSARVKKQSATDVISIAIQESGGSWQERDLWTSNTTDWQLVSGTVQAGSNWVLPIQVFLRAWYANNAAWFDDVSLTRGACP